MEAEGGIARFTYTGVEDIPNYVTHVNIVNVRVVTSESFAYHPNIVEVICDEGVERIERVAFCCCDFLRRVIMPGVKIVEEYAFCHCSLTDVESVKLEFIGEGAFNSNSELKSINLQSVRAVGAIAFECCKALAEVKFSNELEVIDEGAFGECTSLERIAIPFRDGLITHADTFVSCYSLIHVDMAEESVDIVEGLIAALHFEEWRNDMRAEIDSINQILPKAYAHYLEVYDDDDRTFYFTTGKAAAIRNWIISVCDKAHRYKAEHESVLDDAATALQLALPHDIVFNSVLPFLALPSDAFAGTEEWVEGGVCNINIECM